MRYMTAGAIDLKALAAKARADLDAATDEAALEAWRVAHLGRKGTLTSVLRQLGSLEMEERRRIGGEANVLKTELEAALEQKLSDLHGQRLATTIQEGQIDVTLPGRAKRVGRLHPTTQTVRQIVDIFVSLGFSVAEGP